METPVDSSGLAPVVPLIVRGDLAHYRFLARTANPATLRAVIRIMADDLEECLEVAYEAQERLRPSR